MLGRFIFNRIGALVIGVLFILVGLFAFGGADVKCGDKVMGVNDVCVATSNGSSVERSYDEQKSDNQRTEYIALGIGAVILIGGVIANIRHFSKKKAADAPAVPPAPATA